MKTRGWTVGERGQTLIIVAVALTVLLMFVALAIDVGNMYQVRRQMQNAADAGALAGARELCMGNPPSTAEQRAREYAALNGADPAQTEVAISGGRVDVVARVPADMYVADIMGISTVDVGAHAAAVCGAAQEACGLWPVAFAKNDWNRLTLNETGGCGKQFYVWTGDNWNQRPICSEEDVEDPKKDQICNCKPEGKPEMLSIRGRAWLDFSDVIDPLYPDPFGCLQNGCGTKELSCLIRNTWSAPVLIPSCIPGDNGTRAATKDDVEYRAKNAPVVKVPLFEGTCAGGSSCLGGYRYNVTDFGCVRVLGWEQNLELPYPNDSKKDPDDSKKDPDDSKKACWTGKAIAVAIECNDPNCRTACGSTDGSGLLPMGVGTVSLVE